jgi:hypothetical protein
MALLRFASLSSVQCATVVVDWEAIHPAREPVRFPSFLLGLLCPPERAPECVPTRWRNAQRTSGKSAGTSGSLFFYLSAARYELEAYQTTLSAMPPTVVDKRQRCYHEKTSDFFMLVADLYASGCAPSTHLAWWDHAHASPIQSSRFSSGANKGAGQRPTAYDHDACWLVWTR